MQHHCHLLNGMHLDKKVVILVAKHRAQQALVSMEIKASRREQVCLISTHFIYTLSDITSAPFHFKSERV